MTSARPTPRSASIRSAEQYTLHSTEPGGGGARDYVRFTQVGAIGPGLENSPEGENSMSRVYLGVHWRMDQEDGQALGRAVAQYVAANYFQAVPEPGGLSLAVFALIGGGSLRRRSAASRILSQRRRERREMLHSFLASLSLALCERSSSKPRFNGAGSAVQRTSA